MDAIAASPPQVAGPAGRGGQDTSPASAGLPLARLHALRAGYLFIAVGLAVTNWPLLFGRSEPWPALQGVVVCMLVAISLLAFLGVRHPLQMLPVLLFEAAWKLMWLAVVALPAWAAGRMDQATWETTFACLLFVPVLAVMPWRHIWARYGTQPGERWR